MNTSISFLSARHWWVACLLGVFSMLLLPTLTHSILIHPPEYDELLHVLAARGINETGVPAIADGLYTRAEGYTRLIAWITTFGDNELLMARLPALFFGMIATAMLTIWVGVRVGVTAAVAVALLFVISPMTLHSSVLVRFYTVHTLVMSALLLFWYEASGWRKSPIAGLVFIVVSLGLIFLGLQLHDLTKITVLAGGTGLLALLMFDQRPLVQDIVMRKPVVTLLLVIGTALLLAVVFIKLDVITMLRGTVPMWSVNKADNYAYYISALSVELPFLWPLFPLMAILAFYENPRITLFCLITLVVALVINSIAAQKATRYFYHAYPMICIIWAIGFQRLFVLVVTQLQQHLRWRVTTSVLVILTVLSLCLLSAHEIKRGVKLVLARGQLDDTIPVKSEPDWNKAIEALEDLPSTVDTLVVTSGVKGIYTFGDYDYEMSTTVVQDTITGEDFGTDARTNRQVIGQPESVMKVIDVPGDELFILEDRMVNQTYSSPVESIAVLNQRCERIDLTSTGSQLSAWICR